ncbi:MAG: helix-turn-helix domain-containing protein [Solirubrobacterales bacterium]
MAPIGSKIAESREFGEVIRRRRQDLGLTQQQLADSIGVARRVVGELERGKETVRIRIALDAVNALGLTLRAEER